QVRAPGADARAEGPAGASWGDSVSAADWWATILPSISASGVVSFCPDGNFFIFRQCLCGGEGRGRLTVGYGRTVRWRLLIQAKLSYVVPAILLACSVAVEASADTPNSDQTRTSPPVTDTGSPTQPVLQEVVVTAELRRQDLQRAPIT